MNVDAKILSKILTNQIKQYLKRIIQYNLVGFIPQMKGYFNICKSILYITLKMNENYIINSVDAEKAFNKNLSSIHDKRLIKKVCIDGTYFNIINTVYDKPAANIILNDEKLKEFPLRPENRNVYS